ncbi:UDP-N-acetylmuramate dehydrogenase [Corallincola holothuriorum]|uniref:UDP-N-acetylenolpyruvoylglucosamine reductase n=1 Tax=Corallincola holothuriorum TaxID=2282215 RepID=A0A368MZ80_9GAMM|nr:UDP-N-acetylmuramate dehydrogenase [Corallincola holothuriorum]RCU43230.1 UDP-N-acetylmuramate dehydrogenase [Corallincola holothuriorum]
MNLQTYHTFAVASQCSHLAVLNSLAMLDKLSESRSPIVIGGGSNIVPFETVSRPILINQLKGVTVTERQDHFEICAAAGENWHDLVMYSVENGMPGLENLALIPGTVGAAPIQNIGAYGVEQSKYCTEVEVYEWKTKARYILTAEQCDFAYRNSIFKQDPDRWLILNVKYRLPKRWQPAIDYTPLKALRELADVNALQVVTKVIETRKAKLPDPEHLGNSGSFFKNPSVSDEQRELLLERYPDLVWFPDQPGFSKLAAGWMIDNLGLKGLKVGGAAVHKQQALVLVNQQGATGADVVRLAGHIRQRVFAAYGLQLEAEVQLVGADGRYSLDEALERVGEQ